MEQQFTKQFMIDNCGCYSKKQLMSCSFMQSEPITLQAILNSGIPLKDKFWFICKKLATKEQNQQIAIRVAELVLPIYEEKYPYDLRPRKAVEAAKAYIAGTISREELIKARHAASDAADAASDASDAADAAYAASAADAADAASAADAAAADAADARYAADAAYAASAYAADASAYAADASAIQQQLLDYLMEVCGVKTITL